MIIRNEALLDWVRTQYTTEHVQDLREFLIKQGTFNFRSFKNGIFPAAGFDPLRFSHTGYQNAWVRDNFYIAWAHYLTGKQEIAVRNALSLATFFERERPRFLAIINGKADPNEAMNRPHIRFNGRTCRELRDPWGHAQNDALGYFVWFYSRLILDRHVPLNPRNLDLLILFVRYFNAVHFWQDEDNGHWEERRKIEASSIGVVTAALKLVCDVLNRAREQGGGTSHMVTPSFSKLIRKLIANGSSALDRILPGECDQPGKERRFDSALLFLIWPMEVVDRKMADRILRDVARKLEGDYGIKRYLGDSYWAADYRKRLRKNPKLAHVDSTVRDAAFAGAPEAQWCLFDPIVSIIYARRYAQSRRKADLQKQTFYLNRSLGQLTGNDDAAGPFRCPEMYCLEAGRYNPNDHTPLLWTQANLLVALTEMERSVNAQGMCEPIQPRVA